jgi:hypothetical protein
MTVRIIGRQQQHTHATLALRVQVNLTPVAA